MARTGRAPRRLREAVTLIKKLWTDDMDLRRQVLPHQRSEAVRQAPQPIPILIAAGGPQAAKIAGGRVTDHRHRGQGRRATGHAFRRWRRARLSSTRTRASRADDRDEVSTTTIATARWRRRSGPRSRFPRRTRRGWRIRGRWRKRAKAAADKAHTRFICRRTEEHSRDQAVP